MYALQPLRALALAAVVSFTASPAQALSSQEQANKDTVLAFYEAAINQKDVQAALVHIGPEYIQHNPRAQDGVEGLKGFINGYLKNTQPKLKASIKRVIVQGDLVVLHVHSQPEPGALGTAIVDIFRLDKGKIVEHWDVMQPVPEQMPHRNGMF